jgi:toxin FitB
VKLAADSSVVIAAILADHEAHDMAESALRETDTTIAHVAFETYSVLTRLPHPLQLAADTAASIVNARLPNPWMTLDLDAHTSVLEQLATAGVSGGATYDGLIALTALDHDLELLSRDQRATRTYRELGVRFRLLTT